MFESWVLLSLVSAFSLATSDALTKQAVAGNNEYLVAWFRFVFTLPVLVSLLLVVPVPALDKQFYAAFLIALPIEILTIILYVKAISSSPLSLTLPFLALTPLVLIFVSYVMLGEKVSFAGGTGIFLLAAGSYLLHISKLSEGITAPIRAITKEKGSLMMIGVALCYSVTSSLGKVAIEHSSPLFFGITYYLALTMAFSPFALWKGRNDIRLFLAGQRYKSMILPGFFYAIMNITHMTAMKLTNVAYMISVKRVSLLIGVFYGYLLFREENIRERLLDAALMFMGFVLIVNG